MAGRRRDRRYRLSESYEGSLLLPRDVLVERHDQHEVLALSDAPAGTGQELTLDLMSGTPEIVSVRVIESTPVIVGNEMRYRLRLKIIG